MSEKASALSSRTGPALTLTFRGLRSMRLALTASKRSSAFLTRWPSTRLVAATLKVINEPQLNQVSERGTEKLIEYKTYLQAISTGSIMLRR